MNRGRCPSDFALQQFAEAETDEHDANGILAHLNGCSRCQAMVDAKCRDDRLRSTLFESQSSVASLVTEPALTRLTADLERLVPSSGEFSEPRLIGPYRIVDLIGIGGMGRVYRAIHMELDKVVALKLLPDDLAWNPRVVERFRREMKAAGRTAHPNVVVAYDAGQSDGHSYLAMEFVNGQNVAEVRDRFGPLSSGCVCELVRQAAAGIQHIHDLGMVHRDVKPSNLLLSVDGQVKVSDLGLALLEPMTDPPRGLPNRVGTARYAAPEQLLRPGTVDSRSDIFSLGRTLHVLLHQAIAHDDSIPAGLSQVVMCAVAEDPEERYASAQLLADALEPFSRPSDLRQLISKLRHGATVLGPKSVYPDSKPLAGRQTTLAVILLSSILLGVAWWCGGQVTVPVQTDRAPPDPDNLLSASEPSIERSIAEWVIQRGGSVKLHHGPDVFVVGNLPESKFQIQGVDFYGNKTIQDVDVARLVSLRQLQLLNLSRTAITDSSLISVGQIRSLLYLYINHTKVTDAGIARLTNLNSLSLLSLKNTRLSNVARARLHEIHALVYLDLSDVDLDPTGFELIQQLDSLRTLILSRTPIGDSELGAIGELRDLRRLDLTETHITDNSISALVALDYLESLNLAGTSVTEQSVERLRQSLTKCEILYPGGKSR